MEYRVIRHKEGGERANHKYVARVKTDNTKRPWRYFYTNDAYKAFLNGTDTKSTQKNVKFSIRRLFQTGKNSVDKTINNAMVTTKTSLSDLINKGKDRVDKFIDKTEKDVKDTTEKIISKTKESSKKTIDKTIKKTEDVLTESPKTLNKVVNAATKVANKIYDDKNNIYDVNVQNYNEKIEKVRASKEWQDIVARKDREYVKKKSDGTTEYLIDDYLAKKKNPVLDILDDVTSGREITINKVEKDAIVAGLKEQAFSTITIGALAVGIASKILIEKSKLRQGSYNDEIAELHDNISNGQKYLSEYSSGDKSVTKEDVEHMMQMLENSQKVKEATDLAKSVNEENVVTAAKIIMNSESMPEAVKNDEYYKMANDTLSNLSEEEIVLLNILIKNMRSG